MQIFAYRRQRPFPPVANCPILGKSLLLESNHGVPGLDRSPSHGRVHQVEVHIIQAKSDGQQ